MKVFFHISSENQDHVTIEFRLERLVTVTHTLAGELLVLLSPSIYTLHDIIFVHAEYNMLFTWARLHKIGITWDRPFTLDV